MRTYFFKISLLGLLLFCLTPISAAIRLPKLVSDGMILQRDQPITLWGWARPGEKIQASFAAEKANVVANDKGEWKVSFKPQKAGGPFTIDLKGENSISVKDVYLGDVFLCSGQSNMELWMGRLKYKYPEEVKTAKNNLIRQFLVPDQYHFKQAQSDLPAGKWESVSPQTIQEFSGVAYFFAKAIHEKYKVPVGIINAALGGSPIESWLSEETLQKFPTSFAELQRFKNDSLIRAIEQQNQIQNRAWFQYTTTFDAGNKQRFFTDQSDKGWSSIQMPDVIPSKSPQGVYWLRKKVQIPARMLGKEVLLELGRIVDADSVFVNGQFVGQTSYQYPPRRYPLPANVLRAGENTIFVRLTSSGTAPSFVPDKRYELTTSQDTISLAGEWTYQQTVVASPIPAQTTVRWKPTGLYNAMIAPLLPLGLKAVLWYQGESNVSQATQYGGLLQALVQDWRKQFNQPNLPVLVAQLPNFLATNAKPTESDWAVLRSQQMQVLNLPNTGVTNNIDLGEWNDIHPEDKLSVANRFARLAYSVVYKEALKNPTGPICTQVKKIGEYMLLTFSNAEGGLKLSDNRAIRQVAVAGADRKFSWASADIQGNQVRVWNNPGMEIKYVRFAWADNPMPVNLTNKEGIPAFPFEMEVE